MKLNILKQRLTKKSYPSQSEKANISIELKQSQFNGMNHTET